VINEITLAYWERQQLAAALVDQLTQGPPQSTAPVSQAVPVS
jgi:hypothetical protein